MLVRDKRKKLTKTMIDYLINPEIIKEWAGLSLAERAVMLHRKFPEVHISGSMIGLIYKKFKIKRKIVIIKKYSNLKTKKKISS